MPATAPTRIPATTSFQRHPHTPPPRRASRRDVVRSALRAWAFVLAVAAFPPSSRAETASPPAPPSWLSPAALAASPDGAVLHIACATGQRVATLDLTDHLLARTTPLPGSPSGLALSPDGSRLYVTLAAPAGEVVVVDARSGEMLSRLPVGHTPMSPVVSPDGRTLYLCQRFQDDVAVVDLASGKVLRRIPVQREPVAAALTPDGRHLLVANHLHAGRADSGPIAAVVSVIDVAAGKVIKELPLPTGSGLLNDLRISPDGRLAFVTHILARFQLPTTQLERGWMNTNAGTLIDLTTLTILNTVLLDSVDSGAANPWGIAWSTDSRTLFVAHAGTHELSVIDVPGLLARLDRVPATADAANPALIAASRERADVPNDLSFLVGLRQRIPLPSTDRGPRALTFARGRLYAANYYSDTLSVFDPAEPRRQVDSVALGAPGEISLERRGEAWFHDATICFQGWQSCASCHPGDARVDALNWDLLNDDMGNPKNNKSLLLSHRTPPAMSLGVRDTAETAVRAGIRHILFTVQPEEIAVAMDAYLLALQPVPSPHLVDGELSPAARRGAEIFARTEVGCADCHPPGLFTDLEHYDVGTLGPLDRPDDRFDTPTLIELWRTAPYLHDGSVTSVRELFTERNAVDRHGRTSALRPEELSDLVAYLLSL